MSLIDRAFSRLDEFRWGQAKRRSAFQAPGRTISYRNPENSQEKRAIPTFGADPSGFGEDWASYRLGRPGIEGAINPAAPKFEHENTHGHIRADSQPLLEPEEPYQDPSISSRGSRTSEGTDQKPIRQFTGEVIGDKWDGVVRNMPKHDFQGVRGKHGETEGDRAEKDQKYWDFDFRA